MDVRDIASIDFETGSHANLRKTGAAKYAEDQTTRVLCLAYQLPGQNVKSWREGEALPQDLLLFVRRGGRVSGWNVLFEWWVWNVVLRRQVRGQAIPPLKLGQLVDTMAVAAYNGLPLSLDKASEALPRLKIRKDMAGHALMLRMSRPRDPKADTWWHLDEPARFDDLVSYCENDVKTERAILEYLPPLPKREQDIWLVDARANNRGMFLDRPLLDAMKDLAAKETKLLDADMRKLTGGKVKSTKAVGQLLAYVQNWLPVKSLAKDKLQNLITHINVAAGPGDAHLWNLLDVLELRQKAAKSSVAKLAAMENFACLTDDRMRGLTQYYGAFRTGRWAGRGPQIQNYPRGVLGAMLAAALIRYVKSGGDREGFGIFFDVEVLEGLASILRGCISAPAGKLFCSFDYSQIEARVLPWLAGDEDMLDVFRSGKDVYVVAASGIYRVTEDMIDGNQRQIGKVAVLALGFGGGVGAFQTMAVNYGLVIPDSEAEQIKTNWRNANPKIVKFWYDLERAALECVRSGRDRTVGCIKFSMDAYGNLLMFLPGGRSLCYREAEIGTGKFGNDCLTYMGMNQYTQKWERIDTYGGKLAENATQAVARDVMADALLELDAVPGVDLLGSVHDEVLMELDDAALEAKVSEVMNTELLWAPGLPVRAEGYVGDRFRK
jgi:DNA polymerase